MYLEMQGKEALDLKIIQIYSVFLKLEAWVCALKASETCSP